MFRTITRFWLILLIQFGEIGVTAEGQTSINSILELSRRRRRHLQGRSNTNNSQFRPDPLSYSLALSYARPPKR